MKSNGFAHPDGSPDEEVFIDKVHMGHLRNTTPANRAGKTPEFDTMVKGANARAGIGRQACARQGPLRGRHRDGIMRTAARHRPLRAREQRGGVG